MKTETFDVAVIGGGSAGYAAARTASAQGVKVAVIEGGRDIGGLCILRGCMPSKTLLESSHRWQDILHAKEFGLEVRPIRARLDQIIARKKRLIADFASYRESQLRKGPFAFIRGHARFTGPHDLSITDGRTERRLTAKTFILATGSRIADVAIPGLSETGYLTSDTALNLTRQPKSLIVLGGGVIAVELGQFFAGIGTKVTVIQRSPHLIKEHDDAICETLETAFREQGIRVVTGTKMIRAEKKGSLKEIHFEHEGRKKTARAEEILYALGRVPAIDRLNLPAVSESLANTRLTANAAMQTAAPHLFAAGDVVGPYEVVHIAIQQAEVAGYNAALAVKKSRRPKRTVDYRLKAQVTFTDPEIATVGLSAKEAREQGINFIEASYPFNDHGKSIVMGVRHGFVKLLAEPKRGEIIGGAIVGPHASDLIHEVIAVMNYHGTAAELAAIPHYHPTLAEILTYPAEEIAEKITAAK